MAMNRLLQVTPMELGPGPDIGNLINPLMQGFQDREKRIQQDFQNQRQLKADTRADTQLGMQQEDQKFQREDRLTKQMGSMAQVIRDDPDPVRAAANWQKLGTSVPGLAQKLKEYGIDANDHVLGSRLVAAQAGMYVSPMDQRLKQAEVQGAEGRVALQPLQRKSLELDVTSKERELNTPKVGSVDLGPGHSRVFHDPRTGAEIGRINSTSDPRIGPYKDAKQVADVEESMRKEVTAAAKDYNTVTDASKALESISKAPSAAKDIAMVFSFMKILDPASVVRETEYATAAKAAGLDDRFVGYITKIQNGQFLTPEQRVDFLTTAQTIARSKEQGYRQNLERYKGIAERSSVDPRNILPEMPQAPQQPPQPRQQAGSPQRGPTLERGAVVQDAQDAIKRGADPAAVAARLREMGIDPATVGIR